MKIFVTGASGYIGNAVGAALARAGHEVFGLVRSEEQARRVACQEIQPVVGDMAEPESYRSVAGACQVTVHAAFEYSERGPELDRATVEAVLAEAARYGRPHLLVYTSGVWIYGETGMEAADEASAVDPPRATAFRPGVEGLVLAGNAGRVRTLVLRPGDVYGGRGGLTAMWFSSASTGAARFVGDGSAFWPMVHVADLAEAYRLAVESPWGGEVFNVTDRSRNTVRACAEAASRAAGADGRVVAVPVAEAARELGASAEALAMSQHVDSSKAVRMLGWQPRHGGFVDGVRRYFASWRAL